MTDQILESMSTIQLSSSLQHPESPLVQLWVENLEDCLPFREDRKASVSLYDSQGELDDDMFLGVEARCYHSNGKELAPLSPRLSPITIHKPISQDYDTGNEFVENKNQSGKSDSACEQASSDTVLGISLASVLSFNDRNPEEVLHSLGFGEASVIDRIPNRFLSRSSNAKGVDTDSYCSWVREESRQQEEKKQSMLSFHSSDAGIPRHFYWRDRSIQYSMDYDNRADLNDSMFEDNVFIEDVGETEPTFGNGVSTVMNHRKFDTRSLLPPFLTPVPEVQESPLCGDTKPTPYNASSQNTSLNAPSLQSKDKLPVYLSKCNLERKPIAQDSFDLEEILSQEDNLVFDPVTETNESCEYTISSKEMRSDKRGILIHSASLNSSGFEDDSHLDGQTIATGLQCTDVAVHEQFVTDTSNSFNNDSDNINAVIKDKEVMKPSCSFESDHSVFTVIPQEEVSSDFSPCRKSSVHVQTLRTAWNFASESSQQPQQCSVSANDNDSVTEDSFTTPEQKLTFSFKTTPTTMKEMKTDSALKTDTVDSSLISERCKSQDYVLSCQSTNNNDPSSNIANSDNAFEENNMSAKSPESSTDFRERVYALGNCENVFKRIPLKRNSLQKQNSVDISSDQSKPSDGKSCVKQYDQKIDSESLIEATDSSESFKTAVFYVESSMLGETTSVETSLSDVKHSHDGTRKRTSEICTFCNSLLPSVDSEIPAWKRKLLKLLDEICQMQEGLEKYRNGLKSLQSLTMAHYREFSGDTECQKAMDDLLKLRIEVMKELCETEKLLLDRNRRILDEEEEELCSSFGDSEASKKIKEHFLTPINICHQMVTLLKEQTSIQLELIQLNLDRYRSGGVNTSSDQCIDKHLGELNEVDFHELKLDINSELTKLQEQLKIKDEQIEELKEQLSTTTEASRLLCSNLIPRL